MPQRARNDRTPLTLHRSLCPCRRQQPHAAHHEVLERLVRRLPLLAHVICEAGDPGRGVVVFVLEGRFEAWRSLVLARVPFDDVGLASPLLVLGCEEGWWEGGGPLPGAEMQESAGSRWEGRHCELRFGVGVYERRDMGLKVCIKRFELILARNKPQ